MSATDCAAMSAEEFAVYLRTRVDEILAEYVALMHADAMERYEPDDAVIEQLLSVANEEQDRILMAYDDKLMVSTYKLILRARDSSKLFEMAQSAVGATTCIKDEFLDKAHVLYCKAHQRVLKKYMWTRLDQYQAYLPYRHAISLLDTDVMIRRFGGVDGDFHRIVECAHTWLRKNETKMLEARNDETTRLAVSEVMRAAHDKVNEELHARKVICAQKDLDACISDIEKWGQKTWGPDGPYNRQSRKTTRMLYELYPSQIDYVGEMWSSKHPFVDSDGFMRKTLDDAVAAAIAYAETQYKRRLEMYDVSVAMAMHPRLGAESGLGRLSEDLVQRIFSHVAATSQ